MSTDTTDPFAAAQVSTAPKPSGSTSPEPAQGSEMDGGFGDALGSSLLFAESASAPALFNKTHLLGTERTGIIRKTEDKQDRDFNAKMPKFWSESKIGGESKNKAITTDAVDAITGNRNRPVMVTHVTVDTAYRMEAGEAAATGRDADFIPTDDGTRVEVVGGFDYKPFKEALLEARKRGINIAGPQDLVGKRLTVKRASQHRLPGAANPSWVKTYRIDNA